MTAVAVPCMGEDGSCDRPGSVHVFIRNGLITIDPTTRGHALLIASPAAARCPDCALAEVELLLAIARGSRSRVCSYDWNSQEPAHDVTFLATRAP